MKIEPNSSYRLKDSMTIRSGRSWMEMNTHPEKLEEVTVTPVAQVADPGYGYQLDGSPVPPHEGWEIVPEGEAIGKGAMYYFPPMGWVESDNGPDFQAGCSFAIRAYARKKKPEPRRGKAGEVWGLESDSPIAWLVLDQGVACLISYSGSQCAEYFRSDYITAESHTFLAPDLETWARQQWGLGEEERKKLEADVSAADRRGGIVTELDQAKSEIARLSRNIKVIQETIDRDYVRKADVVEALIQGGKPTVEAFAKIGIIFAPEKAEIRKQHNPDGLTPEQVGVSDGWRLLDEDEIVTGYRVAYRAIEIYANNGWLDNASGNWRSVTYRTCLTREELAKARGISK